MKSHSTTRPSILAVALACVLLGCGGSSRPAAAVATVPSAPGPAPRAATAQAVLPAPWRSPSLVGTIVISNDIRSACGITEKDAHFAYDSSRIQEDDVPSLDAVAACFTSGPLAGRAMRLVGHADPRGPDEYNMVLGQSRADSVQRYLHQHGLNPGQAATTSRGAIDAKGQDEQGWARDRRVDVMLSSDRAPSPLGAASRQRDDSNF